MRNCELTPLNIQSQSTNNGSIGHIATRRGKSGGSLLIVSPVDSTRAYKGRRILHFGSIAALFLGSAVAFFFAGGNFALERGSLPALKGSKHENEVSPSSAAAKEVSIILTADLGMMAGKAECEYIKEQMTDVKLLVREMEMLFCESVWSGNLFGFPVLLAATGIGHDRAALCLHGLLVANHERAKEILFLGTGGFSPARGGILNSDNCNEARPIGNRHSNEPDYDDRYDVIANAYAEEKQREHNEREPYSGRDPNRGDTVNDDDHDDDEYNADILTMIGDICVSPMTTNWDCHKCVWPAKVDSACHKPICSMHSRADIFGDFGCNYYSTPSLADEMIMAAETPVYNEEGYDGAGVGDDGAQDVRKAFEFPPPSPELQALSRKYWDAMSEGTGQPYSSHLPENMMPKAIDYTKCAETTSNTFWVGTPYDELARTYVADLVNDAFSSKYYRRAKKWHDVVPQRWPRGWEPTEKGTNESSRGASTSGSRPVTQRDVVAVSAMEGAGWMQVVAIGEVYLNYSHIPAVNIRGAADYVHPPVRRQDSSEVGDGTTTWEEMNEFVEQLNGDDALTTEGYRYAIKTTSMYTINLFRVRQQQALRSKRKMKLQRLLEEEDTKKATPA